LQIPGLRNVHCSPAADRRIGVIFGPFVFILARGRGAFFSSPWSTLAGAGDRSNGVRFISPARANSLERRNAPTPTASGVERCKLDPPAAIGVRLKVEPPDAIGAERFIGERFMPCAP
jgi:hypothetical protein